MALSCRTVSRKARCVAPECIELGVECPRGYIKVELACANNPDEHQFAFATARCSPIEWQFCPYCGAELIDIFTPPAEPT